MLSKWTLIVEVSDMFQSVFPLFYCLFTGASTCWLNSKKTSCLFFAIWITRSSIILCKEVNMTWIVIDTSMASIIYAECHTFCILHFISKLNLCSKISFTENMSNWWTTNSSNGDNSCRMKNCRDDFIDILPWTSSSDKKSHNILCFLSKDSLVHSAPKWCLLFEPFLTLLQIPWLFQEYYCNLSTVATIGEESGQKLSGLAFCHFRQCRSIWEFIQESSTFYLGDLC